MPSQTLGDLYSTGSRLFGPCEPHREPCKERQPYSLASEVPRGLRCTAAHILLPSYCDQFVNSSKTCETQTMVTSPVPRATIARAALRTSKAPPSLVGSIHQRRIADQIWNVRELLS